MSRAGAGVFLTRRPVASVLPLRISFVRNMGMVASALFVFSLVVACFFTPVFLALPSPVGGEVREAGLPMLSPGHLFGTDLNGNDVLARLLYGGRSSLQVAIAVNCIGLIFGTVVGALAAYMRGFVDACLMRLVDALIAFPSIVLVLTISSALGAGQANMIVALSFFSVPAFARIARAEALRLCHQEYITAALFAGTSGFRVVLGHIIPNVLPQLVVFGLLGLGVVIVLEGGLNVLGLGLKPPAPTWGNMIAHGQHALLHRPHLVVLPSATLFLTVLSLNVLGEGLRRRWTS